MKTQPLHMIDCQRELLGLIPSQQKEIARLKATRLAAVIFAVGGWGVVVLLICIRASQ